MPSLEEKFQRLLSIRAQILELVAEADTLVPQGGYLILSDLSELHAGLSAAPAEDPAPEVTNPPANPAPGPVGKPEKDEEENRSHPYTPRPEGPLKGKSLALAVEEVMKTHFTQVAGVNRQIMAILAEGGFDGFTAYSLEDPMELVRNTLSAHPNVDRPTRKTYIWVPRQNSPEDIQGQSPAPAPSDPPSGTNPDEQKPGTSPAPSPTETERKTADSGAGNTESEEVTFLELVPRAMGTEAPENGDEDL